MRRWSVAARLLAASWLLVILMLPAAGALLSWAFNASVTAAFDERLKAVLNVLTVAVRTDIDGRLDLARSIGDPRFEQVFSGWYWQVSDADGPILVSRSLWDERLPVPSSADSGATTATSVSGPRGHGLRIVRRDVQLPGYREPITLMVAGPVGELDGELAGFRRLLIVSLSGLGALLLVLPALQIRWGLAPLRQIGRHLKEVEVGRRKHLDDDLPRELGALARAMNAVLDRDRQLIERGRGAAGNLAHAIKTPLTVVKTLLAQVPAPQRERLASEVERIDEAVRHHLARASAAGTAAFAGQVHVAEALRPVTDGLARMGARRGVGLRVDIDPGLRVSVDPQDLQEMVGNLLENAMRWAETEVILRTLPSDSQLVILVEDDGPGMSEADRRAALDRGTRLDTERSQSGLGLDIVQDLVSLYDGRLELGAAASGGLSVRVALPNRASADSG